MLDARPWWKRQCRRRSGRQVSAGRPREAGEDSPDSDPDGSCAGSGGIATVSQADIRPADACDGQDLLLHRPPGAGGFVERRYGLRADGDPGELAVHIVGARGGYHRARRGWGRNHSRTPGSLSPPGHRPGSAREPGRPARSPARLRRPPGRRTGTPDGAGRAWMPRGWRCPSWLWDGAPGPPVPVAAEPLRCR